MALENREPLVLSSEQRDLLEGFPSTEVGKATVRVHFLDLNRPGFIYSTQMQVLSPEAISAAARQVEAKQSENKKDFHADVFTVEVRGKPNATVVIPGAFGMQTTLDKFGAAGSKFTFVIGGVIKTNDNGKKQIMPRGGESGNSLDYNPEIHRVFTMTPEPSPRTTSAPFKGRRFTKGS